MIPLEELESEALDQIDNVLGMPFLKRLVLCPDCHTGYDMPIGGVALLDGVISPSYVGYDTGCGMGFVDTKLSISEFSQNQLQSIYEKILSSIPAGEGRENPEKQEYLEFINASGDKTLKDKVNSKLGMQIGTLGGGNHFLELGYNQTNTLCITIHSGSRNPGHSVGEFHMKRSKVVDTDLPPGFYHIDSQYGQEYLTDMNFMLVYALENRKRMLQSVLRIIGFSKDECDKFIRTDMVNENHNHAEILPDGILHRKGATPAEEGVLGVIPGNMSNGVVLTRGLGNKEYLCSASHGAGRKMSRKKAKEVIDQERFEKQMKGIISSTDKSLLDEAPDAYKDLELVIARQKGLVIDVLDWIKPVINVKGIGGQKPWEKKKKKVG